MSFFRSKIFAVLGLVAVVWLSWSLARLWPKKITVENRVKSLEQRISETEKSNSALAKLLDYFKSPAYLEREAKLKLNVRKSDENVVFIYPGKEGEGERKIKKSNSLLTPDVENPRLSSLRSLMSKGTADNFGIGATNFEKWIKYLFK